MIDINKPLHGAVNVMVEYLPETLIKAADLLEKLVAENERLKNRCEAAERVITEMAHGEIVACDICASCATCAETKSMDCEAFILRGPQDGGTEL